MNINRLPRGLLSYLDSQTQGENPSQLGQVVAPVLNMEPFYRSLARYERLQLGNLTFDTLTDTIQFLVPSNETWLIHHASLRVNNLTGFAASYAPAISVSEGSFTLVDATALASSAFNVWPDQAWCSVYFNGLFVVPPGYRVVGHLDRITTGGVGTNAYLSIMINRLQV